MSIFFTVCETAEDENRMVSIKTHLGLATDLDLIIKNLCVNLKRAAGARQPKNLPEPEFFFWGFFFARRLSENPPFDTQPTAKSVYKLWYLPKVVWLSADHAGCQIVPVLLLEKR